MRLKSLNCTLILILMWGWVDDLVVSTANADPSDDVATSENDDYLSATNNNRQKQPTDDGSPLPAVSPFCTGYNSPALTNRIRSSKLDHGLVRSTEPLYAFMSLQC
jgi:hypothetical protein